MDDSEFRIQIIYSFSNRRIKIMSLSHITTACKSSTTKIVSSSRDKLSIISSLTMLRIIKIDLKDIPHSVNPIAIVSINNKWSLQTSTSSVVNNNANWEFPEDKNSMIKLSKEEMGEVNLHLVVLNSEILLSEGNLNLSSLINSRTTLTTGTKGPTYRPTICTSMLQPFFLSYFVNRMNLKGQHEISADITCSYNDVIEENDRSAMRTAEDCLREALASSNRLQQLIAKEDEELVASVKIAEEDYNRQKAAYDTAKRAYDSDLNAFKNGSNKQEKVNKDLSSKQKHIEELKVKVYEQKRQLAEEHQQYLHAEQDLVGVRKKCVDAEKDRKRQQKAFKGKLTGELEAKLKGDLANKIATVKDLKHKLLALAEHRTKLQQWKTSVSEEVRELEQDHEALAKVVFAVMQPQQSHNHDPSASASPGKLRHLPRVSSLNKLRIANILKGGGVGVGGVNISGNGNGNDVSMSVSVSMSMSMDDAAAASRVLRLHHMSIREITIQGLPTNKSLVATVSTMSVVSDGSNGQTQPGRLIAETSLSPIPGKRTTTTTGSNNNNNNDPHLQYHIWTHLDDEEGDDIGDGIVGGVGVGLQTQKKWKWTVQFTDEEVTGGGKLYIAVADGGGGGGGVGRGGGYLLGEGEISLTSLLVDDPASSLPTSVPVDCIRLSSAADPGPDPGTDPSVVPVTTTVMRLLSDGVEDDNKWVHKAEDFSKSWIQADFLLDKTYCVYGYSLRSANDSPDNDPFAWTVLGLSALSGQWVKLDVVEFEEGDDSDGFPESPRWAWIHRRLSVVSEPLSAMRIEITRVRSTYSDGVQLGQMAIMAVEHKPPNSPLLPSLLSSSNTDKDIAMKTNQITTVTIDSGVITATFPLRRLDLCVGQVQLVYTASSSSDSGVGGGGSGVGVGDGLPSDDLIFDKDLSEFDRFKLKVIQDIETVIWSKQSLLEGLKKEIDDISLRAESLKTQMKTKNGRLKELKGRELEKRYQELDRVAKQKEETLEKRVKALNEEKTVLEKNKTSFEEREKDLLQTVKGKAPSVQEQLKFERNAVEELTGNHRYEWEANLQESLETLQQGYLQRLVEFDRQVRDRDRQGGLGQDLQELVQTLTDMSTAVYPIPRFRRSPLFASSVPVLFTQGGVPDTTSPHHNHYPHSYPQSEPNHHSNLHSYPQSDPNHNPHSYPYPQDSRPSANRPMESSQGHSNSGSSSSAMLGFAPGTNAMLRRGQSNSILQPTWSSMGATADFTRQKVEKPVDFFQLQFIPSLRPIKEELKLSQKIVWKLDKI
eukprot:gene9337-19380_t